MDYFKAKAEHLVIENQDQQKTFVRTFSTKPSSAIVGKTGKVFGVIEIDATHPEIPHLIDLIIEEVKNNYYYTDDQNLDTGTLSEQFEAALKKTNLAIASFLESEQIELEVTKINILIAIQKNQEIHFTVAGDIGAYLFYNTAKNNFRIINVLDASHSAITEPDPLKFFSQVISGKIRPRDIFFVTTSNLLDYFSLETIKNVVAIGEGIKELQTLVQNTLSKENFTAISINLSKSEVAVKKPTNVNEIDYTEAASQDSIKELVNTEKETAKLLTPSLMPEMQKYAKTLQAAFKNYLVRAKDSTNNLYSKQKSFRPNIPKPNAPNLNIQKKFKIENKSLDKVKSTAQRGGRITVGLLKTIKNFIGKQKFGHKVSSILKSLFGKSYKQFQKLPTSSKLLLVVSVALLLLFTNSIVWLNIKNNRTAKLENFNNTITAVTSMKDEAQSSLIYRDEGAAREKLLEATRELTNLTPESDEQIEQIANLQKEIDQELQVLRHITEIDEPVQVVNFQNLDQQANIAKLAELNNDTIYTQNHNNQSIYKANIDTRVMSSIFSPESNTGKLEISTQVNADEIVFFSQSNAAFRLNPNNDTLNSININITDGSSITDAVSYNNRIYILDNTNSKIYRYSKTASGYGSATDWIKETGIDLSNATSLAIDGSIYVLKSNGEIIKLQNGQLSDLALTLIDPPLENPTKITTTDLSDFLYIMDPATNRVVVINKDGNLVQQYTSPKFDNLKDIIIDEGRKEIYALNDSTVFGIPADHL